MEDLGWEEEALSWSGTFSCSPEPQGSVIVSCLMSEGSQTGRDCPLSQNLTYWDLEPD